ncbi:MAG TPA: hypothetical protein VGL58_03225 [Caulobacteraceae bacterium]
MAAGTGDGSPAATAGGSQSSINVINETASESGVFNFDYGVPSSPALVLAGGSPDKITTSTALKPLVIQIPTAAGIFGQTVGVDVAPGWLAPPDSQTYDAYMRVGKDGLPGDSFSDWAFRTAFRTHIGVAVAAGVTNSDPTKQQPSIISVGFSTSLLEHSDPLLATFPGSKKTAWLDCLQAAAPQLDAIVNGGDNPDAKKAAVVAALTADKAQLDADAAQKAALAQRLQQLSDDQASTASNENHFKGLEPGLQGGDAALRALVDDKITTLDVQAKADATGIQDVQSQLTSLAAQAAKDSATQAADAAKFDAITVADTTAANAAFQKTAAAKLIPACVLEANEAAMFAPNLDVGAGALWDGTPGAYSGYGRPGWVVWASYRHPLGATAITADKPAPDSYWMVGASGRASWNELLPTGVMATPMVQADTLDIWAGVERVSPDTRLTLQGGYQWRDPLTPLAAFDRSRFRYYVGFSQRLGPKDSSTWLQIGYGDVTHTSNDRTVLVSLSFSPPSSTSILGVK